MKSSVLKRIFFASPFIFIFALSVFSYFFITPAQLVSFIGIENAYVLMFSLAALGGATTFNTVPYYSMLFVLATAGVNPFVLGLSSAAGVMCGDSLSYVLGRQGRSVFPETFRGVFERMYLLALHHRGIFPFICFVYGSISPLSNDFITIPAGMARIPYLRVMIPLAAGNIVFNVGLAYGAFYGITFVRSAFGFLI